MATQTKTPSRAHQTVELARYVTDMREQRILAARRGRDGIVRIFDLPVDGLGASYRVDEGLERWAEIAMLRRDYLHQAEKLGDCPMSPRAMRRLVELQRREEALS